MLISSIGMVIVTFLRARAGLILPVVLIHEEENIDLKLIASELTVVIAPIACLLIFTRVSLLDTQVQAEELTGLLTTLASVWAERVQTSEKLQLPISIT